MMEFFVVFVKIFIYILYVKLRNILMFFFWNCEKFGSFWKIFWILWDFDNKFLYSLEVVDVLFFWINNVRFIFCDRNR